MPTEVFWKAYLTYISIDLVCMGDCDRDMEVTQKEEEEDEEEKVEKQIAQIKEEKAKTLKRSVDSYYLVSW